MGVSPKVNVTARLKFELAYYNFEVYPLATTQRELSLPKKDYLRTSEIEKPVLKFINIPT